MNTSFGARLRQQRERQQIELSTIADRTKIKLSLLEALERDDVSHWPGGIFRRSYFRAYAQAIGLDPDAAVREFLEHHPEPVEEDIPSVLMEAKMARGSAHRRPPTRLRFLIDSAISALPARRGPASPKEARPVVPPVQPSPLPEVIATPEIEAEHPVSPAAETVDVLALADLCTRLSRATATHEVVPVLEDAMRVFAAVGLILWMRDARRPVLTAVLAHGYSNDVLAHLPGVAHDDDNAIAVAFRTAETRVVPGDAAATGAIVAPLLTPAGCAGVLAFEFRSGLEDSELLRASATILAAQLSTLLALPALVQPVSA